MVHLTTGISLDAPNGTEFGHVGDSPEDLMYSGDQVWTPSIVDYNKDDYCNRKALPAGTANLTDSPLLSR